MSDEERRVEQRKEFKEYKDKMDGKVDKIDGRFEKIEGSIASIDKNQALTQADTKASLTVLSALHDRLDEFDKVLFKGNGRLSILETLAVHSSWLKWWGGVTMLIIASLVVGYFNLSAAPPIVAVEVTSKG